MNLSNLTLGHLKNYAEEFRSQIAPRNETEKKVYEAIGSANWGASTTLMNEIASETFDYEKYSIIMTLLWKSLDTNSRTWKHIFKALTLIEFLVKNGNERVVEESRDHLYSIRPLQDFNFYDGNVDKGTGVREKAKALVELLSDNEIIREEREKARTLRNKFVGISNHGSHIGASGFGGGNYGAYDRNSSYSSGGIGSNSGGSGGSGRYSDSSNNNNNYNNNNDRDRGGNNYNNNNNNNNNNFDSSRYGGGAYDSSKPPRFDDNAPSSSSFNDNTEIEPKKEKKLKVNIKSSNAPPPQPKVVEPEVDLLGDLGASVAPPVASGGFDPFGTSTVAVSAPVPVQASPPQQQNVFTSFNDPMQQAHVMQNPPQQSQMMGMNTMQQPPQHMMGQPMGQPMGQQMMGQQMMGQQMMGQQMMGQQMMGQPPQQQMMQQPMSQPIPSMPMQGSLNSLGGSSNPSPTKAPEADFGDFEKAPTKIDESKWGNLGGLVDFGGIKKNADKIEANKPAASQAYSTSASFAGLDGISQQGRAMNMGMSGGMGMPMMQGGMQGGMQSGMNMGMPPMMNQGSMQGGMPMMNQGGMQGNMPPMMNQGGMQPMNQQQQQQYMMQQQQQQRMGGIGQPNQFGGF